MEELKSPPPITAAGLAAGIAVETGFLPAPNIGPNISSYMARSFESSKTFAIVCAVVSCFAPDGL